jgi:hypothetical protein
MEDKISYKSDLHAWLQKRRIKTTAFAEMVQCTRAIIWKAKRGIPICPLFARRIRDLTGGEILPLSNPVGAGGHY